MKQLSAKEVKKTNYPERVLQFGEGNFMRAFVDWQIDQLNKAGLFNGSVVIVQPLEQGLGDVINQQDGLYTLILEGMKDGQAVREKQIIESVSRVINPFQQKDDYFALAQAPELEFIFSNTTEAGIVFDQEDLLTDELPKTFPGKLTAFLYQRFIHFNGDDTKGMTIIPCELIENNADQLKKCILQYADLWDLPKEFVTWIEQANQFCNSLVDRIVPGYPKDKAKEIEAELGYADQLIVVAEHYHLWVIEGDQALADQLPVEKIGLNTLFVEDLTPYRSRKVKILNGTHTAMTPISYLMGLETVEEAINDPLINAYLTALLNDEVLTTLPMEADELQAYTNSVLERFENPYIKHQLLSISLNSIAKFATRNLPVLLEFYQKEGKLPDKLVFAFAALLYFYRNEQKILKDDREILDRFESLWLNFDGSKDSALSLVHSVLSEESWWNGEDLTKLEGLEESIADLLIQFNQVGMKSALTSLLGAENHA
ncbi:tagaturonate reductase [Amphibacillus sp. MSJ-3]|uniref:tagaturonate reductase n=1 Tax=Amphibacillus sp. MSJ-3 TaxID=2841505 RepID=UPI001C0EE4C1|nr:tagaturonate reductase [Amphibacillus sp. MSJ-3]MBU5594482.1 tagaturonate reductase [Amphibacillus sp. MSJ-3]